MSEDGFPEWKIKLADKYLPSFMSEEDYKKLCEMIKKLKKKDDNNE